MACRSFVPEMMTVNLNRSSCGQLCLLDVPSFSSDHFDHDYFGDTRRSMVTTSFPAAPSMEPYLLAITDICAADNGREVHKHYVFVNKDMRVIIESSGILSFKIVFGEKRMVLDSLKRENK